MNVDLKNPEVIGNYIEAAFWTLIGELTCRETH